MTTVTPELETLTALVRRMFPHASFPDGPTSARRPAKMDDGEMPSADFRSNPYDVPFRDCVSDGSIGTLPRRRAT